MKFLYHSASGISFNIPTHSTVRGISLYLRPLHRPVLVAARSKAWSAAARLLRSWVRIPPGSLMSVSCECLRCQVGVSATSGSLAQRSPTKCGT